jgi:Fungal rhodopsin domain
LIAAYRPISAYWTLSFVPQHCINERIHLVIQGSFNIVYDFCVVLIPIPIVLKLNLPLRQRIIVALLFGIGFVVCFAGIVRTYYMYKVTDGYHDITWDAYPVWFGTAVELYLGIVSLFLLKASPKPTEHEKVCTSAPPTKPFFARYVPKLLSATNRSQNLTFTSSQNNTFNPIHSFSSRDREASAGMEFESLPRRDDSMKKRSEIYKTVEVEIEIEGDRSWLDTSRTPGSSTAASFVKLVH